MTALFHLLGYYFTNLKSLKKKSHGIITNIFKKLPAIFVM